MLTKMTEILYFGTYYNDIVLKLLQQGYFTIGLLISKWCQY